MDERQDAKTPRKRRRNKELAIFVSSRFSLASWRLGVHPREDYMTRSIITCGTLSSGEMICVATERTHNSVYVFDGRAWHQQVRWAGKEATAACACGDAI